MSSLAAASACMRQLTWARPRQAQFTKWNDALKTKNNTVVADLYASDDLSFLPTVEPRMLSSRPETLGYFAEFLKKEPSGEILQDKVHACGSDGFVHSGIYNFTTNGGPVPARFSYLWRKQSDGSWKIMHHHSSKLP